MFVRRPFGQSRGFARAASRNPSAAFVGGEGGIFLVVFLGVFAFIGSVALAGSKKREMVKSRRLMAAMREDHGHPHEESVRDESPKR